MFLGRCATDDVGKMTESALAIVLGISKEGWCFQGENVDLQVVRHVCCLQCSGSLSALPLCSSSCMWYSERLKTVSFGEMRSVPKVPLGE